MGKIKSAHYYEKQALELGKHEIRESAKCIRGTALRYLEADAFEILLGKKPVQRYLEKAKIQLFKFSDSRLCALSFLIHDSLENNQDSIKETVKKIIPNLVLTLYSVENGNSEESPDGIVNGGKCHWTDK